MLLDAAFLDMEILVEKLSQLAHERAKKLPFVETVGNERGGEGEEKNIKLFWDIVKEQSVDKSKQAASGISPFINENAANRFITLFSEKCKDASIILQWKNLFKGQKITKNEKSDLFRSLKNYFPNSGECTYIQNLAREAMGSGKQNEKSEEQRIVDRDSRVEQAKNRREAKEATNTLKYLAEIRKTFIKPDGEKVGPLSYSKQVSYAIEALKNIQNFIMAEDDISRFLNNINVEVEDLLLLWAKVITNPKLSAAIEYNASQFLNHLEIIVNYKHDIHAKNIPGFAKFIDEKYEQQIRTLRNHLEHGCPMLDSRATNILNEGLNMPTFKQQIIPLNIINLVKELLPLLNKLKIALLIGEIKIKPLALSGDIVTNKLDMGKNVVRGFCEAAKENDVEKLNRLFNKYPYHDIDTPYEKGCTPLHYALFYGRSRLMDKETAFNAAKVLILNAAKIDVRTANKMPLEYLDDEDVIRLLEQVKIEHAARCRLCIGEPVALLFRYHELGAIESMLDVQRNGYNCKISPKM